MGGAEPPSVHTDHGPRPAVALPHWSCQSSLLAMGLAAAVGVMGTDPRIPVGQSLPALWVRRPHGRAWRLYLGQCFLLRPRPGAPRVALRLRREASLTGRVFRGPTWPALDSCVAERGGESRRVKPGVSETEMTRGHGWAHPDRPVTGGARCPKNMGHCPGRGGGRWESHC